MSAPSLPTWSHGLLWAASEGDAERLKSLLEQGESPDTTGGVVCWLRGASEFQNRTPLHYAAKNGHPDCVKLLLLYGADPNCRDEDGYTPIHYVCQMFKPIGRQKAEDICRCLRYLIDFGGDFRAKTKSSHTPIELAIRHKNSECATQLLKYGMHKKHSIPEMAVLTTINFVNVSGLKVEPLLIQCRRVVCGFVRKDFLSPIKDLWIPESLKL